MKSATGFGVACAVLVGVVAAAHADTTYLASSQNTLYRVTEGGETEAWTMSFKMRAMHHDSASGTTYVLCDQGGGTPATVHIIENELVGTPTFIPYANLSQFYGSLTAIDGVLYGFKTGSLYTIDLSDPANPVETLIGDTGLDDTAGAAYDPVGQTLYMLSFDTDALYGVDPATANAKLIAYTDVSALDWGAEWFDGQLYVAVRNADTGALEIGTIDVSSGAFTMMYSLTCYGGATSLTVLRGALTAPLDIKPGSCPNSLNVRSRGLLPVALLGTGDFDVAEVDLDSVQLVRADGIGEAAWPLDGPPGPRSVIRDVGTPFEGELCDCHELGADGIPDLLMKFHNTELVDALELMAWDPSEPLELILSGSLLDGTPFEARDCIQLR